MGRRPGVHDGVPGVPGVDDDVYDRHASSRWDEDDPLNLLHGSLTPARFGYFRSVLTQLPGRDPAGARALDIGCGGGFLAEEFARLGCAVVGVDPSAASLATARAHAAASGLAIDYRVGRGEDLPVEDHAFDVVYCCDVLEHVGDLERVVAETARALAPGGVCFFDTVNRTRTSRVLAIRVLQEWRWTRVFDTPVHRWEAFITPGELAAVLGRHGLLLREVVGLGPRVRNPLTALRGLRDAQRGRTSYGELSRLLDFGPTRSLATSYAGCATVRGSTGR